MVTLQFQTVFCLPPDENRFRIDRLWNPRIKCSSVVIEVPYTVGLVCTNRMLCKLNTVSACWLSVSPKTDHGRCLFEIGSVKGNVIMNNRRICMLYICKRKYLIRVYFKGNYVKHRMLETTPVTYIISHVLVLRMRYFFFLRFSFRKWKKYSTWFSLFFLLCD